MLTCREAGRLGGLAGRRHGGKGGRKTAQRHGTEFYRRIGRLGGLATQQKRAAEQQARAVPGGTDALA